MPTIRVSEQSLAADRLITLDDDYEEPTSRISKQYLVEYFKVIHRLTAVHHPTKAPKDSPLFDLINKKPDQERKVHLARDVPRVQDEHVPHGDDVPDQEITEDSDVDDDDDPNHRANFTQGKGRKPERARDAGKGGKKVEKGTDRKADPRVKPKEEKPKPREESRGPGGKEKHCCAHPKCPKHVDKSKCEHRGPLLHCTFCGKSGHDSWACFQKYPEKLGWDKVTKKANAADAAEDPTDSAKPEFSEVETLTHQMLDNVLGNRGLWAEALERENKLNKPNKKDFGDPAEGAGVGLE